ncbi:hypothetical protein V6N11_052025 [Hibiscus sabdariffa]|uniref:Uncharacterized protein n=1 Tax=Hibiscus sabdariffa TaxID=183260 RepID=A0ABR2U8R0_9ROSI
MIGKVVKVDTRRIDLNMVEYLRIGIILDVTKPVCRCVAIGAHCATFKPTTNTKLQYGDWLRYIPPKKQELQTRSKGSIRYMEGVNNTKPKADVTGTYSSQALPTETNTLLKPVAAAANIIDSVTPKAATGPIGTLVSTDTMLVVATDSKVDNTLVKDTKLAAATAPTGSNISTTNVTLRAATGPLKGDASDPILLPTSPVDVNINVPMVAVGESHSIEPFVSTMAPTPTSFGGPEGFIDFMANSTENPSEVPYLLDNVGLDDDPTNILPIPREGGIDYELGKSFLATSSMLVMYDDWLFNKRSMHTATIEEEAPLVISRGAKRRSSLPSEAKPKKPRPSPPISKTRAGMSRVKTLRQRLTFNPAEENEDSMLELSRFGSGLGSSSLEEHCVTA